MLCLMDTCPVGQGNSSIVDTDLCRSGVLSTTGMILLTTLIKQQSVRSPPFP